MQPLFKSQSLSLPQRKIQKYLSHFNLLETYSAAQVHCMWKMVFPEPLSSRWSCIKQLPHTQANIMHSLFYSPWVLRAKLQSRSNHSHSCYSVDSFTFKHGLLNIWHSDDAFIITCSSTCNWSYTDSCDVFYRSSSIKEKERNPPWRFSCYCKQTLCNWDSGSVSSIIQWMFRS